MSDWKPYSEEDGCDWVRSIGPVHAKVFCRRQDGAWSSDIDVFPKWLEHDSASEARETVDSLLRKAADALSREFAPVLRWVAKEGREPRYVAFLGRWRLEASDGGWWNAYLRTPNERTEYRASWGSNYQGEREAKRAAEAALRALGVVFRTEGE